MNYKTKYARMCAFTEYKLKINIFDFDYFGYAIASSNPKKKLKISEFIWISPRLNYQDRYFTLLHEIGHLFYFHGNHIKKSKKVRDEKHANKFAMQMCENEAEQDLFRELYKKAGRYNKKNRDSWREIIDTLIE